LVDGEDAAVGARHQAVVDGLRVAEPPAFRDLDGVDVADQVADRGVGRGELLAVALVPVLPGHRQLVAQLLGEGLAASAGGRVRVVVDLAAVDDRGPLVEEPGDGADEPGLALAALTEQDQVVTGEQRPFEMGQDSVVEAHDAREPGFACTEPGQQVLADLGFDGAMNVAALSQLAKNTRQMHGNETTCPRGKAAGSFASGGDIGSRPYRHVSYACSPL